MRRTVALAAVGVAAMVAMVAGLIVGVLPVRRPAGLIGKGSDCALPIMSGLPDASHDFVHPQNDAICAKATNQREAGMVGFGVVAATSICLAVAELAKTGGDTGPTDSRRAAGSVTRAEPTRSDSVTGVDGPSG